MHDIGAADPVRYRTAVGAGRRAETETAPGPGTVRLLREAQGVGGCRHAFDAADGLVEIRYQLVAARDDDDGSGPVTQRRHTVAVAVDVIELSPHGDSVGRTEVGVGGEAVQKHPAHLFRRQAGSRTGR